MTAPAPHNPTQQMLMAIGQAFQSIWDAPETDQSRTALELMQLLLVLRDPTHIDKLNLIVKLFNASETDRATLLEVVVELDETDLELKFLRDMFTRDATTGNLPEWRDLLGLLFDCAKASALAAAASTSTQTPVTPPAAQPTTPTSTFPLNFGAPAAQPAAPVIPTVVAPSTPPAPVTPVVPTPPPTRPGRGQGHGNSPTTNSGRRGPRT